MRTVVADSFYFIAAINEHDGAHKRAITFAQNQLHQLVTTEWVLTEVGDAFAKPQWRPAFLQMLDDLRADPNFTIVPASHKLFEDGVRLFGARGDKEWSLTDCTSFVAMKQLGVTEALSGDHHFQQAGFTALLAE